MLTLSLAACYKTASANEESRAAAFDLATRYMGKIFEDTHVYFVGRAGCIYSLLAVQCGEEAVAHEELAFVKSGMMRTNIQVYLYTKMNRLSDAIKTIEDAVRPADVPAFRRQKPRFSVEVVKTLTSTVEVCEDEDTKKRLAILFHRLDDLAEISQVTDVSLGNICIFSFLMMASNCSRP